MIGRTGVIDGEGGVVWLRMCAESRVEVMQAREKLESVRNAGVTPDRSLTNTAPIARLSTPSSVMQAKRAPDLSDQMDPGHTSYCDEVGTEKMA